MRINTRACYAIRLMADVAAHCSNDPVPLKDVARRQRLSKLYLSQLTMPLRNASLLKSVWGNKGGYALGRPAGAIRILDIVEAVDGPVGVMGCLTDPAFCDRREECDYLGMWQDVNQRIVETLSSYTLADVLAGGGESLPRLAASPGETERG